MSILDKLFPKNYIPYSERHVPSYHYDALRTQSKYDAINRPRGTSVDDWNDWVDAWDNAKYYAAHPEELKHVDGWERPPEKLLQAAKDYHAGKLKL